MLRLFFHFLKNELIKANCRYQDGAQYDFLPVSRNAAQDKQVVNECHR